MSANHNLSEEKGEPKRNRAEVLPLTSLTPYRWATPAHLSQNPGEIKSMEVELGSHCWMDIVLLLSCSSTGAFFWQLIFVALFRIARLDRLTFHRTQERSRGGRWSWAPIAGWIVLLQSWSTTGAFSDTCLRDLLQHSCWKGRLRSKQVASHWRGPRLFNVVVLAVAAWRSLRSLRVGSLGRAIHRYPIPPCPPSLTSRMWLLWTWNNMNRVESLRTETRLKLAWERWGGRGGVESQLVVGGRAVKELRWCGGCGGGGLEIL